MNSAFNNKFFLKSLKEITGSGIVEFYTDNSVTDSKNSSESKEHYPSGRPKLFQKLVVFLSGLETSFQMNKRHKITNEILKSLTNKESAFQKLIDKEYIKVSNLINIFFIILNGFVPFIKLIQNPN